MGISEIANRNKIIINEARKIMNDYRILDLSFREPDAKMANKVCNLIKDD